MDECAGDHLNHLIVQVCRTHRMRASVLFAQCGLHVGQDMLLRLLWTEDGLTLSQLAERTGVQPPTVTRMVRRMGKKGFVERRDCAADGRVYHIFLTAKGRALKVQVDRVWTQLATETAGNLTEVEKAALGGYLERIRDNLMAISDRP